MPKLDRRLLKRSLYTALALIISGAVLYTLYTLPDPASMLAEVGRIVRPLVWGVIIAYILAQPCSFFEKKVFRMTSADKAGNKKMRRGKHAAALICTVAAAAGVAGVFLWICLPQLADSLSSFSEKLPNYADRLTALANDNAAVDLFEKMTGEKFSLPALVESAFPSAGRGEKISQVATVLTGVISNALRGVTDFLIGFVIAVYLLSAKETFLTQSRKLLFAVFHNKTAQTVLSTLGGANKVFRSYLTGLLLDCSIVGCVTFVFAMILGAPYPLLIGMVVALTNFIPFFGPLFGGVPTFLIIFLDSPTKGVIYAVFLAVLQQIDGHIIVPTIQRDATGLPSVWVVVSIIVGGGLFGIVGMFLAVPVFAVIYSIAKTQIDDRLTKKHLPADSAAYARSEDYTRYIDGYYKDI
ncbi:AI-2E family transporter [Clostridia bacterium]|nr:AI-2E family transporter [Clostridia bacterium]